MGLQGDAGPQGEPGRIPANGLTVTVLGVNVAADRMVSVHFALRDARNQLLPPTETDRLGFAASEVVMDTATPPAPLRYRAFTTCAAPAPNASDTITCMDYAVRAPTVATTRLTDNRDGTWTYQMAAPLPDTYTPSRTLSIAVQARRQGVFANDPASVANVVFDTVPAGGTPVSFMPVSQSQGCNNCHGSLAAHGGGRVDVRLCVRCHTEELRAPGTHESLEFGTMIHQIHRGERMPSVAATPSVPLVIAGTDYSHVAMPADLRNCQLCHNESAPDAPNAARWAQRANIPVCSSCHNNINFGSGAPAAYQIAHPVLNPSEGSCGNCHGEVGSNGTTPLGVRTAHVTPDRRPGAPTLAFAITSVTNTTAGSSPTVNFTINDRTGAQVPPLPVNGPVTFTGTGNVTLAVTGIAAAIQDIPRPYNVRVRVVAGGAVGAFTFVYSFNGGTTWIGAPPTPLPTVVPVTQLPITSAATYTLRGPVLLPHATNSTGFATSLPSSNLTLNFSGTGNAVVGDEWAFTAQTLPLTSVAVSRAPAQPQQSADGFVSSLGFYLNGPVNTDYAAAQITGTQGTLRAGTAPGSYSLTFPPTAIIPTTATGTWTIGMQAARYEYIPPTILRPAATSFSHGGSNPLFSFAVTPGGTATPRREVVQMARCNNCHDQLMFHGNGRQNVQYCALCHTPNLTAPVPGQTGVTQSLQLQAMVHRIHMGAQLPSVVGGGTYAIGNANFNRVRFPQPITNCESCHAPNTYAVSSTRVCTSCHDAPASFAHAQINTTTNGAEACEACHGANRTFSVAVSH